jgi:hypothetical protein
MDTTIQDNLREIRKEFFAFRNGIIANKLRDAGDPHDIIMGCLLVYIVGITSRARERIGNEIDLATVAQVMWNDTNSRECRLAAPMLFPPGLMSGQLALTWCQDLETTEIADNLCHKLLRHIADSQEVMSQLIAQEGTMAKYTGYRLMLNLILLGKLESTPTFRAIVEREAAVKNPALTLLLHDIDEAFEEAL